MKKRGNVPPSTHLYSAKMRPNSAKIVGYSNIKRINITTNSSNQQLSETNSSKNAMIRTNQRLQACEERKIVSATPHAQERRNDEKQPNLRELLKEACQVIKRRKEEVGSIIAVNNIRSNSNRHNK